MDVIALDIPDVKLIVPAKFGDERGFFSETYNQQRFLDAGIDMTFVQDNHSLSADVGVLRGLHYQKPPFAQDKLVRVLKGRILDVAVDLRKDSPTFGQHVSAELSAENWTQILVPIGFAHGFVTLEPNTEVTYKVTAPYAPDHEDGIMWNDPDLDIDWPIAEDQVQLSAKDKILPAFKDSFTF
ncbi:dTDP-4-dehydrorhamnose 3,5-epimerase [Terasakiella sp. A23]|uniref:dTDP-4-dehydrorhamnose 3,5-epimerase n=1 Tax=Terasakiella sp. FCG-A23 TaxID=3080561 RepID=UPI002955718F|nr:dTDP-4-dehydrorhamnose 3,5-epimerase [Terasakiella sp. A23]MDV7341701.1 dTDP-4-dehydrorhamnose 3,5-epimerase [Terasakiella sp. A23]